MVSGNVAFAVDGDPDRDWGSLPRAGEQRPVLPLAHLADDLVADARDGALRHGRSANILEVGRDLAGS